jgi:hypothetical protein
MVTGLDDELVAFSAVPSPPLTTTFVSLGPRTLPKSTPFVVAGLFGLAPPSPLSPSSP